YQKLARTPESLFPIDVERKNPPIIRAVIRGGESFETSDKPIGERHSSPIVITPYAAISHKAETLTKPFWPAYTAPTITRHESAEIKSPSTILLGVDGSLPFRRRYIKNPTTT